MRLVAAAGDSTQNVIMQETRQVDTGDLFDLDPSNAFPDASLRMPISLRIVAFGFVLVGVLSAVDMIVQLFFAGKIYINFGVLFIFIGRGLYQWSERSRSWAAFLTWWTLALVVVWFLVSAYAFIGGELPDNVTVGISNVTGLLYIAAFLGYLYWQLCVLRRPDIVQRFQIHRSTWWRGQDNGMSLNPRYWRFSLWSLFLAITVVAFVIVRLQAEELWWQEHAETRSVSYSVGNEFRRVDLGVATHRFFNDADKLRFVLLTRGKAVGHGASFGSSFYTTRTIGFVTLPDGRKIQLPRDYQLFEIVDGQLIHRDEHVTKAEFESYFRSRPTEWSIDALIEHAKKLRARPAEDAEAAAIKK